MSASSSKHITSEYDYHGDDLQVHLHFMNNENQQEPPLLQLLMVPSLTSSGLHPKLQSVEGHWTLFSVTMMSFKNLFTHCHTCNCYGYY